MSVFKCKMCGGTIEFNPGDTVGICDSCGTKQTLPRLDDDRKANLYDRANHFRRNNEFDKAMGIYEQILNEDPSDSEAYWSLVLCRYGIEYVEDPATHKRVPTVNRAQFTSIFDDDNYKSALQHADSFQKAIYEEEANTINEIQKGILAISQKEEPFDVFICYKETDNNGRRTQDSVLANDLYHQLTQEGFKVFFSRITLEDKLGTAYEPYIFAALNSAKAMVVLGTKPEYFNAVWVKNEWSRYLSLVKQSGGKKVLIPAYRDMDPYDLPEEFSHLQAQDMSKLGFMQDLIRGIKKIVRTDEPKPAVKETVVVNNTAGTASTAPLLRRAFMFLEDGEWAKADDFCEQVLNIEPENAQAYLGKLMAELKIRKQEDLVKCEVPFEDNTNYQKVNRFGDEKLTSTLKSYIKDIEERKKQEHLTKIYNEAKMTMDTAGTVPRYEKAIELFERIKDFSDSQSLINICREKIEQIEKEEEANHIEKERKIQESRKRSFRILKIFVSVAALCLAAFFVITKVIIPTRDYNSALKLLESGKYEEAMDAFRELHYKDSKEKFAMAFEGLKDGFRNKAKESLNSGDVINAAIWYRKAGDIDLANSIYNIPSKVYTGEYISAGIMSDGSLMYQSNNQYDYKSQVKEDLKGITAFLPNVKAVAGVDNSGHLLTHYAGLTSIEIIKEMNIKEYSGIVSIIAGISKPKQDYVYYVVMLLSDGTVKIAKDSDENPYPDISNWKDIISIQSGSECIYGIDKDGNVYQAVEVGNTFADTYSVSSLSNVKRIVELSDNLIVLSNDGTVSSLGEPTYYTDAVNGKEDVKDICYCEGGIVLLYTNGTVELINVHDHTDYAEKVDGYYKDINSTLNNWYGIVEVQIGACGIIGIKYDGSVKYVSTDIYYENKNMHYAPHSITREELESWKDIVMISSTSLSRYEIGELQGWAYAIGVKSNGMAVSTGEGVYYTSEKDSFGKYQNVRHDGGSYNDVANWKLW